MSCEHASTVLHGYLDGELDAARASEFERHLESCPECLAALEAQETLRSALQRAQLYETAPVALRRKIRASLPATPRAKFRFRLFPVRWLAVTAAILLVAFVGWRMVSNFNDKNQYQAAAGRPPRRSPRAHHRCARLRPPQTRCQRVCLADIRARCCAPLRLSARLSVGGLAQRRNGILRHLGHASQRPRSAPTPHRAVSGLHSSRCSRRAQLDAAISSPPRRARDFSSFKLSIEVKSYGFGLLFLDDFGISLA